MFRLLDRYVLRECLGPFLLGLLVFTFMLLISLMFRMAEMIIQRDVPTSMILELLFVSLPHILVLTIPMALLFGVLIAIGRLSSDSELIAMRSAGMSLFALYRPVMLFSVLTALLTGWFMLDAMPRGNTRVSEIQVEIFERSVNKQVQARTFYDGLGTNILFAFEVDDDGWTGVFFSEALPGRDHMVQMARHGSVHVLEDGTQIRMNLEGTAKHRTDLDEDEYYLSIEDETSAVLEDRLLRKEANRLENRSYKSMTLAELREWKASPKRSDRERRNAEVEAHQKFAIPAACLVFALFAVPLGFNSQRGGRSSGFALSIPIILIYHIMQSNGRSAAVDGQLAPWVAMWLPNVVFLVAGLFLMARKNRDKSLMFTTLDRWVRQNLWSSVRKRTRLRQRRRYRRREHRARRREQRASVFSSDRYRAGRFEPETLSDDPFESGSFEPSSDGPSDERRGLVLRLPRQRLLFPTLIDRYLLGTFLRIFLLVVASGLMVYILADLTELFDDILDHKIPLSTVFDYYQVLSFQIFKELSPLVVLLTVLIGFGVLSRTSEIIAAKAAGLSLYRLAAPALFAAALVSGANVLLESKVLPYSNARAAELKAEIKGRPVNQRTFRRADRQWLAGSENFIYHFQNYDPAANRIQRLHVFHFNPTTYELDRRMYAQEAHFQSDNKWAVSGAWTREFSDTRVTSMAQITDGTIIEMLEKPEFFDMEVKTPDQMLRADLKRYIEGLKAGGQDVTQLEVQLHNKVALPAISLIMCFVALPFAFRLGKKGALYGIGLAIGLGIFFYAIIAVFTTLGLAGLLPPLVSVWSPHVLFASLSLYLFLGIET